MTSSTRWTIDPNASLVRIDGASSVHPVRASASGLEGWIEAVYADDGLRPGSPVSGRIEIDVDRLRSGNPLIDRETRRRILARRHPQITGEVTDGSVTGDGDLALTGVIDFRGERVQVEGTTTVTAIDRERIVIDGSSRFDVRWWGLRPPRVGLLRVYPEIDVAIHVEAHRDA